MKRINLTMTRGDAAILVVTLDTFLDFGEGNDADDVDSVFPEDDMERVRRIHIRLDKLLKRPDKSRISIFAKEVI